MDVVKGLIDTALARGQRALSEYESKQVVAAYGIAVVKEVLVPEASAVLDAAEQIGYPVVVKACSPALMHKSDQGLVKLNLDDAESVRRAVAEIGETLVGAALDGYLVQQMVQGKRELIVGGVRDALFGPCVMLGLGGILVEAIADVTFRLAPLDDRDAHEMVNELRAQRMLESVRGEPAADRQALSQALIAVGQILIDHPRISQVDVNPLILEGTQPVAVDALVTLVAFDKHKDGVL
jgi:acetate---CoA ligase (ADP-forming) subunit beta